MKPKPSCRQITIYNICMGGPTCILKNLSTNVDKFIVYFKLILMLHYWPLKELETMQHSSSKPNLSTICRGWGELRVTELSNLVNAWSSPVQKIIEWSPKIIPYSCIRKIQDLLTTGLEDRSSSWSFSWFGKFGDCAPCRVTDW